MRVQDADHRIIDYGVRMVLTDFVTGTPIVVASRGDSGWEITPGERSVGSRREAVDTMIDVALELLPGDGYSTFVPGHRDEDGNYVCLRDYP